MNALRRLVSYFTPYRSQLVAGLALVVLSAGFSSVVPWLLRLAIDRLRAGAALPEIWSVAGGMVVFALIGGALRFGMRQLLNGVSRRIEYDLRNALFQHLETLDAPYYARTRTGDLMARLTNDLGAVRMAAGPAIMYLVNTIAGGLFAIYFMVRIDLQLTVLAVLPMVFLPPVMARVGTAIHHRFEAVQEHFSTLTTRAQENLAGTRIVRAYRQERAEVARFGALNEEYLQRNMHLVRLWGMLNPLFGLLAGLGGVIVLGVGGSLVVNGTISVGEFVAFGFYLAILTWPLIALGWVINLFQRGAASMARLNEIFDAQPGVRSAEAPRSLPRIEAVHYERGDGQGRIDLRGPPGGGPSDSNVWGGGGRSLEFRGVGFHYPVREGQTPRWVLRDISFHVPAGATLGIVGATGSGKSALMDLIPRLYDPQEGEILIDGVPIRELSLRELRAETGFVPQETLLFSDTISANLGYGTEDPDAARWAAGVAQLDSTIVSFPGGYDTMLGERGINLSGGQKQRAALARALARRPSIVLLDDALSAVDTHTEAAILAELRGALAGRTAVIASHRISAIRDASWIIVLDEGRIVEQGRHADLLANGGRYWTLLRRQQLVESIEDEGEVLASRGTSGTLGA